MEQHAEFLVKLKIWQDGTKDADLVSGIRLLKICQPRTENISFFLKFFQFGMAIWALAWALLNRFRGHGFPF